MAKVDDMDDRTIDQRLTAADLHQPRVKRRRLWIALAYRVRVIAERLLGPVPTLRMLCNLAWIADRLAFEQAGRVHGQAFHTRAKGLRPDDLAMWVPPEGRVLDVGCGVGQWAAVAASLGADVVGIDHDERVVVEATRRYGTENARFMVVAADAPLALCKLGHFDVALLVHVLEHVENPVALLQELSAMSSTAIIEVPDFEAAPLNLLRWHARLEWYSDADHVQEYTEDILRDQLAGSGWKVRELRHRGGAIVVLAERD